MNLYHGTSNRNEKLVKYGKLIYILLTVRKYTLQRL